MILPRYPIYIISKGRAYNPLTARYLEKMGAPFRIVIEPQEYDDYAKVVDPAKIIVLPFSNLGQGSIPARNFCWEHSIQEGHAKHWILDDNIAAFYILYRNIKYYARTPSIFAAMEAFVDRYRNVALAGPQYEKFSERKKKHFPIILNSRIYSCILIRNDLPYRWRGRYNEDTDLSLRVLKDGWCTILFYAFLQEKRTTMTMRGGNTDELYQGDGRLRMAQALQEQHPDVVEVVWKWNRWQHRVDYSPFRRNRLERVDPAELSHQPQFAFRFLSQENARDLPLDQLIARDEKECADGSAVQSA